MPTKKTARGRLVLAAVELFGDRGYEPVGVSELAQAAETTTGPLYHHFGSKLGLYQVVRRDVEQRIVDRMQGALESQPDLGPVLTVGLAYPVRAGLLHLVGEPPPEPDDDPIAELLTTHLGAPLGAMVTAAWRQALLACAEGAPQDDATAALNALASGITLSPS